MVSIDTILVSSSLLFYCEEGFSLCLPGRKRYTLLLASNYTDLPVKSKRVIINEGQNYHNHISLQKKGKEKNESLTF